MPKMIEISAAEYERLQDCIREDGMRIAALIEENKELHQDAKRLTAALHRAEPENKPLTLEEERYYLEKSAAGDLDARNVLIERNLRLVAHIMNKG